jgi:hypothetical protein
MGSQGVKVKKWGADPLHRASMQTHLGWKPRVPKKPLTQPIIYAKAIPSFLFTIY